MNHWKRHRGNVNDVVKVALLGVGSVAGIDDLSTVSAVSATVQFSTGTPVPLTAAVTDAAASEVTVNLGTWLSGSPAPNLANAATPGCWKLRYLLTFPGAGPLMWPEDPIGSPGWDEITVVPSADA
jgi:hypothetical protein